MGILLAAATLILSANAPVYYLDLSPLNQLNLADPAQARQAWDTAHLVASLQGIVNRDAPRLYIRFMPETDDFWWNWLRSDGQWLAGREVVTLNSWQDTVRAFPQYLRGTVVYDERVAATSNLASTIAGIEDRLCLRYDPAPDSIYSQALALGLPCTANETRLMAPDGGPMFTGAGTIPGTDIPSTGSAKCDAYLWAKEMYLDGGLCSGEYMAYYIDAYWLKEPTLSGFSNATLTNHDFYIAHSAFFFDLGVWEEESPIDDPGQKPGTDPATLHKLIRSQYDFSDGNIINIGGFTPWAWKYTNEGKAGGTHGGVDTEWKYAKIISEYNGIMDADALGLSGMANASFYQHYPLKKTYPQNPRPTAETLRARGLLDEKGVPAPKVYVCFYMGDYDSAAWFTAQVPKWWTDPAHGDTLCTWAFNPNLDNRAPHVMDYVRTHQSPNDWFLFGDSGAGYLNPGMLHAENRDNGLPSGLDKWVEHNLRYAARYDLDINGFVIDGHAPGMGNAGMDGYMKFAPRGLVGQKIPPQGLYKDTLPYLRMRVDLAGTPEKAGETVAGLAGRNFPRFHFIRTILQSPSWHKAVMERARALDPNIEFVDPYTFFLLLTASERNKANTTPRDTVSYSAKNICDGLAPVVAGDGPYTLGEKEGKPALLQPANGATAYLYFEVADAFAVPLANAPDAKVTVEVTVFDDAPGQVGIHYDADTEGPYRNGPTCKLEGAKKWVDLTFPLTGAKFQHSQNSGADFRLVNFGNSLAIRDIALKRD